MESHFWRNNENQAKIISKIGILPCLFQRIHKILKRYFMQALNLQIGGPNHAKEVKDSRKKLTTNSGVKLFQVSYIDCEPESGVAT